MMTHPFLSTRRPALNGHEVRYDKNGGYIIQLKTGHRTKFVVYEGVYFIKLKELKPPTNELNEGLGRQGP